MRDQRTRRRQLTQRGRATLLSVTFAAVVVLGWLVDPFSALRAASRAQAALPAVSAGAPPVADGAPELEESEPRSEVPAFVLERLPMTRDALALPVTGASPEAPPASSPGHLFERIAVPTDAGGTFTVEYTLDAELTRRVFDVLENARVGLGNVIVMDPNQGRVLAYASTDAVQFPPTRSYPAASLVKVITAAAALDRAPDGASAVPLQREPVSAHAESRLDPPARGREVTLGKALATSNNQCFAQLAVHAVGVTPLIEAIGRFGWL